MWWVPSINNTSKSSDRKFFCGSLRGRTDPNYKALILVLNKNYYNSEYFYK